MKQKITSAVLGSTGYAGLELINVLSKHPNVTINFLGSDTFSGEEIIKFDNRIKNKFLPKLDFVKNIDLSNIDVVFLAFPHAVSHKFVKENINKSNIIDLSADFRLNDNKIYKKNYKNEHSCPNLLDQFIYGLPEINHTLIQKGRNIAIPGCYPTSVLLPLIPLFKENIIKSENIIIDSKSGYSGAGKKFDLKKISNNGEHNFYNYNTNQHRHICEINQELSKSSISQVKFSFNPHIMPIFRGMMSTLYCDLRQNITTQDINKCLNNFYANSSFVYIAKDEDRHDFFKVQNTNNCYIKLFKHYNETKIILVSLIDNLLKGASGQAVQSMNIMFGFEEYFGLDNLEGV